MPKTFKIGTRGSLLATTQCGFIKNQLEEISDYKFELETISTQGDENTQAPLWQLDGKDFFTKELDEALLTGKVDLVVHSYKDLGSERPEGIHLGAITERKYPHDILLLKKKTAQSLIAGNFNNDQFIVGTSSPRRIFNITKKLKQFIPSKKELAIETKDLRGNVNTRIQKLLDGNYDAIVLAFAGLERLANEQSSKEVLEELIKDLNFSVLPLSEFPCAAAQGALAIEYGKNLESNSELVEIINKLNHSNTIEEVSLERKSFLSFGGGCHLAVGISVKKCGDFKAEYLSGTCDDQIINEKNEIRTVNTRAPKTERPFIGVPPHRPRPSMKNYVYDELIDKRIIDNKNKITSSNIYVTSSYVIDALKNIEKQNPFVWTAGSSTWKKVLENGFWVNGCSDSCGEEELNKLLNSELIKTFTKSTEVISLTSNEASFNIGEIYPTYEKVKCPYPEQYKEKILKAKVFYWTSYNQYEDFIKEFPEIIDEVHCCGIGKTLKQFQDKNIDVIPFISIDNFETWVFNN